MEKRVSTFQAFADQDFCICELLHIKEDFLLGLLTPLTKSLNLRTGEVSVSEEFRIVRSCIQTIKAVLPFRRWCCWSVISQAKILPTWSTVTFTWWL